MKQSQKCVPGYAAYYYKRDGIVRIDFGYTAIVVSEQDWFGVMGFKLVRKTNDVVISNEQRRELYGNRIEEN